MNIISGGSFCISANMLRKYGIRKGAMPFDWLFCSVQNLVHILDDNFATFLKRSNYRSMVSEPGQSSCLHGVYDGWNRARPFFRHKDPTGDIDYLYYRRCVERFHRAAAQGTTLLVFEEFGEIDALFPKLVEVVTARYPKIAVRAVRHSFSDTGASLGLIEKIGAHELWRFSGSAVIGGVSLSRPEEQALIVGAIVRPGEPLSSEDSRCSAQPMAPSKFVKKWSSWIR